MTMQTARQEVVTARDLGRDLGRDFGRDPGFPLSLRALAKETPARTAVHAVAERMLLDAARRAQRRGAAVEALVLRLSQMPPPGAKPHHRRIARSLLDEAALRRGGQVFALRNLDLVLLSPEAGASRGLLARLFGDGNGVVQVLAADAALLAYAQERAAEDLPLPTSLTELAPLPTLDAAEALLQGTLPGDLLHTQVAAELLPGGALRPLFREAIPNLSALTARLPGAGTPSSPFHDLAAQLDARTLAIACADLAQGGPLSGSPFSGNRRGPALHLNLSIASVLSPGFTSFAEAVRASKGQAGGGRAGIELLLMEACADPPAFERARSLVRTAGFTLALDGVGYQALRISHPGRLGADLVKLEWSGGLAAAEPDTEAAVHEIGPTRVVLAQADSEAALRWGYARGVRRFQGRHMDAMLAAARLGACTFASGCTLRLCAERGSAAGDAGRVGCGNTALLDAAA
jgi:EAL domain-containing protein (putative c-di-GMP-specific phosphodiesterase class I)